MKIIKVVAAVICDFIDTIEYDYPTFHLSMDCFWCEVVEGTIKLLVAEDAKWLIKNILYDVKWVPADITLISKIEKIMEGKITEE